MSNDQNPLGNRGKAAEDKWARDRDAKAIQELKKKGEKGAAGGGKPASKAETKKVKGDGKRKGK